MRKSVCIFFVWTAFNASLCFAVESDNQVEFYLGHGSPLSTVQASGSSDRAGSQGDVWSADIMHHVNYQFYLGLGGGQFRSSDNVSQTYLPNANSSISTRSSSIFILSHQDLPASSPNLVPYVLGGIGWVRNTLTITAIPVAPWPDTGTSEQRTLMEDSRDSIGIAAGAGMDWTLTSALFFGGEVRYQYALARSFSTTPKGQSTTGQSSASSSMNNLFYSLKLGVKY